MASITFLKRDVKRFYCTESARVFDSHEDRRTSETGLIRRQRPISVTTLNLPKAGP